MGKQVNVNFHLTFKPEKQYISSILELAGNISKGITVKEISSSTGIPQGESSGKVEPHINYATYMGLIDFKKEDGKIYLSQTELGKTVFMEDPGLQEKLTLLMCHAMMLRKDNGADVWYSCFKEIFPKYSDSIGRDILIKELSNIYDNKVNIKNFAPFASSYEDMFSILDILRINSDKFKYVPMQYDKEFIYLYAYILISYWEELFFDQAEISSIQFEKLGFGKSFCWDANTEYEVLEKLSDKGMIRMNRQLMPYTILKLTDKDELLNKLYSELC
ncbi:MAG: hypothetical protein J6A58_13060 [Oscillospiraceae bacterium]|nr:hypothetical protein [Oscillospiraceae bacterium]